jgi:hypothetical protein
MEDQRRVHRGTFATRTAAVTTLEAMSADNNCGH